MQEIGALWERRGRTERGAPVVQLPTSSSETAPPATLSPYARAANDVAVSALESPRYSTYAYRAQYSPEILYPSMGGAYAVSEGAPVLSPLAAAQAAEQRHHWFAAQHASMSSASSGGSDGKYWDRGFATTHTATSMYAGSPHFVGGGYGGSNGERFSSTSGEAPMYAPRLHSPLGSAYAPRIHKRTGGVGVRSDVGAIGASGTFFMQPASPSAHAQVQMRALAASQRAALHTTIPLQRDKKREEKLRFVADLYFRFCTGRPAPQSKAARGRSEARSAAADGTVDPPSAGDGGAAKSDNELRAPRRRRKSDPAMSPLSSPVGVEDSLFGRAAPSLPRSHSLSDLAAAAEMLAPEAEAAEDAEATVNAAADGDASTEVAAAGAGAKMAAAAAPAAPTGPREVWSHFSDEGANAKLHPELSRKPILISAPTAPRPELAPGDSDAAGAAVPPMMSASGAASLAAVVARNPGADGSTTAFFRPLSPQLMHAVDAEYGALSELDEVLIHALMRGRDTLVIRQKGLCPLSLHSTIIATFLRAASMPPAPSALDLAAFADCTGGGLEAHTLLSTLGAASPRTVIVVATWEMAARVHADAMRFFSLAGYTQRSSAAGAGAGAVADAAADLSAIGASRAPRMRCCVLHARGSLHRQLHAIGLGCDVLIATPALLEEVVRHKILSLACAMLLVVLDTDWMMKNGHRDKLDAIVRARTAAAHCAARFGMRREQLSAPPTTMLPFESIGRQSAVVATAGSGADSSRTSRRGHSRTQNVHKRGNNFAAAATEWAKTHVLCEPVVVRADLMVNGATCEGGGPRGSKGESRGASGSGGAGGEVVGSGARGRGGAGSSSPRARFISKFVKINDTDEKAVALLDIIRDSCGSGRILIFFNSKAAVQKMLAHIAASGVQNEAFAIHGRMTPNQRDSAIAQFVAAPNAALLATEVVSRWVDTMPEIRTIVNYDMPTHIDVFHNRTLQFSALPTASTRSPGKLKCPARLYSLISVPGVVPGRPSDAAIIPALVDATPAREVPPWLTAHVVRRKTVSRPAGRAAGSPHSRRNRRKSGRGSSGQQGDGGRNGGRGGGGTGRGGGRGRAYS